MIMRKIIFILSVCFVFWGIAQCGVGGSAAPQSSIPLPSAQDPITVSAPDADGLVRVIGSTGAVPNSSIVVIEVGVTLDAALSLPENTLNFRTTCASDLPECPSLGAENKCQYAASEDGSFTLQVPAEADENILVSYLDPDTCAETAAYTVVVTNDVVGIDMEVVNVLRPSATDPLFLIGYTESGDKISAVYDLVSGNLSTSSLVELEGMFRGSAYFKTDNEVFFLVMETTEGAIVSDQVDTDTGEVGLLRKVLDDDGNTMTSTDYLATNVTSYTYGDVDYPVNQIFFYYDQAFRVFEFGDDLSDEYLGSETAEGDIETQTITTSFPIVEATFSGFSTADITSFPFAGFLDGVLVLIMGFEHEGQTWYVALKHEYAYTDIYYYEMNFNADDTEMIVLGQEETGVFVDRVAGYGSASDDPQALSILKLGKQDVTLLDITGETLVCFDDDVVFLFDYAADDGDNGCVANGGTDEIQVASDQVDTSYVLLTDVLFDSENTGEMFVVGDENAGSGFITQHGAASVFETTETVSAIHPIYLGYDPTGNAMIVIDGGNADDGSSNIIVYELASTPSSY